jgi:glycosyltransferase involved in cell wall biosynthesis
MRVLMLPHLDRIHKLSSGVNQVVSNYFKYLPLFGIEMVGEADECDLVAGHIGQGAELSVPYVAHIHGLSWTADYSYNLGHYQLNARIIRACRHARAITVPSAWVAEPFQRDMRISPHVVPHGVDWQAWQQGGPPTGDYVLWNKNRNVDVCDPTPVVRLAQAFPKQHFVTTFLPPRAEKQSNVNRIGLVPHDQMKKLVQNCLVYLATTKETFGIGTLEAMAAGVPVLAFAHGGNAELVEHGVNGYVCKPGDWKALAEGLDYCLEHRRALGDNGREMAKRWSWEAACKKVAAVYREALEEEPPTVGVVIPVYNKSEDEVRRAIESVRRQSYNHITDIIVVDDGSDDGGKYMSLVEAFGDARIVCIRQSNRGVAIARNRGMAESNTKYVSCLDSDDAIGPDFITRCVEALEADDTLGVAYAPLWYIKPDGSEGLSQWPGEFDFDKQLEGQNQVPTCCVFRREMWERLGGYRQRYAPRGAGEEDAEFWLRCGACGWGAKRVEAVPEFLDSYWKLKQVLGREPSANDITSNTTFTLDDYADFMRSLFIYSWQSGIVSGDKEHKVTDWTGWHPWVSDGRHPFASLATPKQYSHPVRQYDEPTVSVIIPVGPGHEEKVINALDSLEAQTFRQWEAIVVWDAGGQYGVPTEDGKGVALHMPRASEALLKAYPYVRIWHTGKGEEGPGYARNRGAEIARAPFLFFLDADDWCYPEALEMHVAAWNEQQAIIYSDYVGRSIVAEKYAEDLEQRGKLLQILKKWQENGEARYLVVSGPSGTDYNCEKAQRQPELDPEGKPYLWCNVTALVPKTWHDEIGGFDEDLPSWEDVDYHWRMAKAGKCYHRVDAPLLVYNYHTGHRREGGRQDYEKMLHYLEERHKGLEAMPCSGCGGRRNRAPSRGRTADVFASRSVQPGAVQDDEFVLCVYEHPNRGRHQVTGGAMFDHRFEGFNMIPRSPTAWSINYGYRAKGDRFLVHREDMNAQPHLYVPVQERRAVAMPQPQRVPLEPPKPMPTGVPVGPAIMPDDTPAEQALGFDSGEQDEPSAIADQIITGQSPEWDEDGPPFETLQPPEEPTFNLQKLPGVGGKLAAQLMDDGIKTKDDLLRLGIEGLSQYKGVGEIKAARILKAVTSQN